MTDQITSATMKEASLSESPTTGPDGNGREILLWGHDGPGRGKIVERITDALSPNLHHALDEEQNFTVDHLRHALAAQCAVISLELGRGVDHVIRKHCVSLRRVGISDIIIVVGSDEEPHSQVRYDEIARQISAFSTASGITDLNVVPFASAQDDLSESERPQAIFAPEMLKAGLSESAKPQSIDFRMAVTAITGENGTNLAGSTLSGQANVGDKIVALPSSETAEIIEITQNGERGNAASFSIELADPIKVETRQIIAMAEGRPEVADQVRAKLFWTSSSPMLQGRTYAIELAGQSTTATITDIRYRESYNSQEQIAAKRLHEGDLGEVNLSFDTDLAFDSFEKLPGTGLFCLRDKITSEEVGCGLVLYGLRRATNIHRQAVNIDTAARANAKGQQPCCIWFTGLSGSGKSTIANALETRLHEMGHHTYILDGDNVRHGLNRDLGFTDADRVENIRRIGEVARLMVDSGLIVMTAFISPFRSERRMARELMEDGQFIEVFVDTSLDVCEARDPKGLYKKARAGEIANFTGIDSAYEAPEQAELAINAGTRSLDQVVDEIVEVLKERNMLSSR